jgi:NAD(P)-dependent dehydrogenase (short-subunit alcohol dehydrogenase family)
LGVGTYSIYWDGIGLDIFSLKNRVAVVTGAGSGIGKAIALCFAKLGAKVSVWDIKAKIAERTAKEIVRNEVEALPIGMDISKNAQVLMARDKVLESFGKIDILVANAAIHQKTNIFDINERMFMHMIEVNLKGTFLVIKAVLPHMVERRYGKIIVTTSPAGRFGTITGAVHYAAAKGGVDALMRSVAFEVAKYGINVNALSPGFTQTPMGVDALIGDDPEAKAKLEASIPIGRMAEPMDVARGAAFLATPASDYVCGHILSVCGGANKY